MTDAAEQLLAAYPSLASIPAARFAETAARLPVISVETGTELFAEGQACQGFPCVLSGQVRVARGSVDGRELELYRVGPGEVCVVSAGCLFGALALTAHGHASMPTRLVLVDRDTLLEWSDARPWRLFLLGLMAERLAELTTLVEAVAFQRLDQRLARSLLGMARRFRRPIRSWPTSSGPRARSCPGCWADSRIRGSCVWDASGSRSWT